MQPKCEVLFSAGVLVGDVEGGEGFGELTNEKI